MENVKHTDGKWEAKFDSLPAPFENGQWRIKSTNLAETPVAILPESMGGIKDENGNNPFIKANAKLIAAAPELLDALTMLVEETEEFNHLDNKNRAILAKAREKARAAITKATK